MEEGRIDYSQVLRRGEPVLATYRVGNEIRTARKDIVITEGKNGGIDRRSVAVPLDFYLHRGSITPEQHQAGSKLYGLWYYGVSAGYRLMIFGERMPPDEQYDAGQLAVSYRKALDAIRGASERQAAYWVCCEGYTVSELSGFKSRRTARLRGMERLKSALDDLAVHFKLA